MINGTFRIFSIVCYDKSDTLDFDIIISNIIKHNYTYAYIKHKPELEEKKEHYHIMIYFDKPTTISKISKELNIKENYINVLDEKKERYTLKKTIGYFIHYNNKEKINYDISDIVTNNQDMINKYYNILTGGKNEKNELKEIITYIDYNKPNARDLLYYCIENDYIITFKKYSYILYNIVKFN